MVDSIKVVSHALENHAGMAFTAVSGGSHVGHFHVFYGGPGVVYSHIIARALAEFGVTVKTEYCVFDAEIKSEEAGAKLVRSVRSFAQASGAGVITIGLVKEAYDDFFPESEDTRCLRSVLSSEGFGEVPGSQGQAMYYEVDAGCETPQKVSAIDPTAILHPGDRDRFSASMLEAAQNLERLLEQTDQALLEQGYTHDDIQTLRQNALTARQWADFHTSLSDE